MIDFTGIAHAALRSAESLLRELFPQGPQEGREFCVADLVGAPGDDTQNQYAFQAGATLDESIADLTIDAMKLGFEPTETLIASKRIVGWTESEINAWIAARTKSLGGKRCD